MRLAWVLRLLLLLLPEPGQGYSGGAPTSACDSLVPGHGVPAQSSASPYELQVDKTVVSPGEEVTVTLVSTGRTFKGFLAQARADQGPATPVGSFQGLSSGIKHVSCSGKADSVTHTSADTKNSLSFKWVAASSGQVEILATFVEDYSNFWVKVPSEKICVKPAGKDNCGPETITKPAPGPEQGPTPEPEPGPTPEPEPGPTPEPEPEPEAGGGKTNGCPGTQSSHEVYQGCGYNKTCFGFPQGCEACKTCQFLATWKRETDSLVDDYKFELFKQGAGPVGIGFSTDGTMGGDLVIQCNKESQRKRYPDLLWTTGKSTPALQQIPGADAGIKGYEYKDVDGEQHCEIETSKVLKHDNGEVDLTQPWTILLAAGTDSFSKPGGYHGNNKIATANSLKLETVTGALGSAGDLLFRLHGLLMVVAWVGCAGAGMILARYFKQTWKGQPVCGKDRWFQAHRLLMGSTVTLSALALFLVAYQLGFRYTPGSHPTVGGLCLLCAFLQPLMALARPGPTAPRRNIFNWAHWAVGNLALLLGQVAILLAGNLGTKVADLASAVTQAAWAPLILVFVIFHVVTHILFSLLTVKAERISNKVGDHQEMNGNSEPAAAPVSKDQAGAVWRKLLLLLYIISAAILTILLACAIFGSLGGTGDSNSGAQEYGGPEPEPESEPEPEPEG